MRTIYCLLLTSLSMALAIACTFPSFEEASSTESSALLSDSSTQRILGFERLSDWSIRQGPGALSLSREHTQGASSLKVLNPGYTIVQSAHLSTLGSVGTTLTVDFELPSNLSWGALALTINIPSVNIYNAWVGQISVSGLSGGVFRTATFTLPTNVVSALASTYTDLAIEFTWNVPTNSGQFLLDNVRFPNASSIDAGVDATADAGDGGSRDAAVDANTDAATGDGSISPHTVFAKPNLKEITVNDPVANRVFNPQGVIVDRNVHPNAVYVFDSTNQRILGFKSLGTCSGSGASCTYDQECPSSQSCTISQTTTRNADLVFGQPDFNSTTCNGDDTTYQLPTASTLCTLPFPASISIGESGDQQSMAVDSQSNLYIIDKWNQRVLRYNDPLTTDTVADMVWGQPDMFSRQCNGLTGTPSASTICLDAETPGATTGDPAGGGVDVLSDGSIWVTDQGNSRLLRFPPNTNVATMVLGQPDYVTTGRDPVECDASGSTNTGQHLCLPKVVRYNPTTKQLYVIDWKNGYDKFRVLIYTPKGPTDFLPGQVADTVLVGDPWYNCLAIGDCPTGLLPDGGVPEPLADTTFQWDRPSGLELPSDRSANAFWLADGKNSRVVQYALSGTSWTAVQVIGQPTATSIGGQQNCPASTSTNDMCNIGAPGGSMGMDGAGNMYIADESSERVLRFPTVGAPTLDGGVEGTWSANAVLFPNLANAAGGENNNAIDAYGAFSLNNVKLVNYSSGASQMILFDQFRLLFWNTYTTKASGSAADGVLYQPNFNSNIGPNVLDGLDTDSKGHVFVAHGQTIDVFQGPLASLQTATVASFDVSSVPLRIGGTLLAGLPNIVGIAYDEKNDALFVADTGNFRVLRIATPMTPSSRVIDLVLGQPNALAVNPNRSKDTEDYAQGAAGQVCIDVQPDGFGHMAQLRLDNGGNLFVVDASHEGWMCDNNRVVEYDASNLLPGATDFFCGALDSGCTTARRPTRYFVAGNPATGAYPIAGVQIGQMKGYNGTTPYDWPAGQPLPIVNNGDNAPNVPIGVAFDGSGHMMMVLDGYENSDTHRVFYYANPLPTCASNNPGCYVPFTSIFPTLAAQPTDVSFDSSGNLVIMDQTWSRVLYYTASDYTAWVTLQH
jgi:hypothetical protein